MISFNNFAGSSKSWPQLKSVISQKNLTLQYEEGEQTYTLYAIEVETLVAYVCVLWKGLVPNTNESAQSLNDTYKVEFEGSYKTSSNRPSYMATRSGYTPNNIGQLVRTAPMKDESDNLLVNGSMSNPHVFTTCADDTFNITISEIRFVLSAQSIIMDGTKFAGRPALENGVMLNVVSGGNDVNLALLKRTEDLIMFSSPRGLWTEYGGQRDLITASMFIDEAATLIAGTEDCVKVIVQDDLTNKNYKFFSCLVVGRKLS
jgi:hypothetical protein